MRSCLPVRLTVLTVCVSKVREMSCLLLKVCTLNMSVGQLGNLKWASTVFRSVKWARLIDVCLVWLWHQHTVKNALPLSVWEVVQMAGDSMVRILKNTPYSTNITRTTGGVWAAWGIPGFLNFEDLFGKPKGYMACSQIWVYGPNIFSFLPGH